jgi:hypothetical protein
MDGDARRRFCKACSKSVTDLSTLTEDEARAFLAANRGACVRYTRDAKGLVIHAPCDRKATEIRRRRMVFGATVASALWSGAAFAAPAARQKPDWVTWVEDKVAAWFAPTPASTLPTTATRPTTTIPEVTAPVAQPPVQGEVAEPVVMMGGFAPAPRR